MAAGYYRPHLSMQISACQLAPRSQYHYVIDVAHYSAAAFFTLCDNQCLRHMLIAPFMMKVNRILLLSFLVSFMPDISGQSNYTIPQPLRVTVEPTNRIKPEQLANEWINAFKELRGGSITQIDILATHNDVEFKITNVHRFEQLEGSGFLLVTFREGTRDYRAVIDPRDIRMIRDSAP